MDESGFQRELERYKKLEKLSRRILGVTKDAGPEEIKKAYWKLAMKYHPDRFRKDRETDTETLRRFQNIQAAYQFLVDGKEWKPDSPDLNKAKSDTGENVADNDWKYFLWWRDKFF